MLAASPAGGAGMSDGVPMSLNLNRQRKSAGVSAEASNHPAGSRPQQGMLRSCMRRARPLQAASACSRKRVHYPDAVPPVPKRARCEASADGWLHELAAAAASVAAAAQEATPLPDKWMGDEPADRSSDERKRESEEAHWPKCQSEAHNHPQMCEEGGVPLWEDAVMPQAEQRGAGSS